MLWKLESGREHCFLKLQSVSNSLKTNVSITERWVTYIEIVRFRGLELPVECDDPQELVIMLLHHVGFAMFGSSYLLVVSSRRIQKKSHY